MTDHETERMDPEQERREQEQDELLDAWPDESGEEEAGEREDSRDGQ